MIRRRQVGKVFYSVHDRLYPQLDKFNLCRLCIRRNGECDMYPRSIMAVACHYFLKDWDACEPK